MPKVSVIIPVYNVEKYLAQCLDSVLNQTLKDIEIICVNDGSTDKSGKILDKYAKKDKRIQVIHQKNQGLSASRNNAMKLANGEYIQFLDSDDWLREDACEILYTKAKANKLDMLNFAGINYYEDTQALRQVPGQDMSYAPTGKSILTQQEVQQLLIPISAARFLYNRKFLQKYDITFPEGLLFEDNIFCNHAVLHLNKYGIENEVLYFRRVHSESITQNFDKHFEHYIKMLRMLDSLFKEHKADIQYASRTIEGCCNFAWNKYQTLSNAAKNTYKTQLYATLDILKNDYKFSSFDFNAILMNEYYKFLRNHGMCKESLLRPVTFNEKIQWLKLHDSTPIKTRLTDKYLVRDWVAEEIGSEYLIPLIGAYDSFDEINFDKLPQQFVIKCNHGSGYNIVVTNKNSLDIPDTKAKIERWMSENYAYKYGMEQHYRTIKPKIIIEEFVSNDGRALYDYKFWCFNGKVHFMQFRDDYSSNLKMAFYDLTWNKLPFFYDHPQYDKDLQCPDNYNEMIAIAEKLCKDFAFVCVDLYRLSNGDIKFGEMTFTRSSGTARWNHDKYNKMLGRMINLPSKAYNIDTGEYYDFKFMPWYKYHIVRALTLLKSCIKHKRKDNKKTIDVLGVRVWAVKYSHNNTKRKFYLCGLRVADAEHTPTGTRHRVFVFRWKTRPSRKQLTVELNALKARIENLERRINM